MLTVCTDSPTSASLRRHGPSAVQLHAGADRDARRLALSLDRTAADVTRLARRRSDPSVLVSSLFLKSLQNARRRIPSGERGPGCPGRRYRDAFSRSRDTSAAIALSNSSHRAKLGDGVCQRLSLTRLRRLLPLSQAHLGPNPGIGCDEPSSQATSAQRRRSQGRDFHGYLSSSKKGLCLPREPQIHPVITGGRSRRRSSSRHVPETSR